MEGSVTLTADTVHQLRVDYFEAGGGERDARVDAARREHLRGRSHSALSTRPTSPG